MRQYIAILITIITLLGIGVMTYFMTTAILKSAISSKEQSCDKFGNYAINTVPSRCYKYFTGQDK